MSGVGTGAVHERGRVASMMDGTTSNIQRRDSGVSFSLDRNFGDWWQIDGRAMRRCQGMTRLAPVRYRTTTLGDNRQGQAHWEGGSLGADLGHPNRKIPLAFIRGHPLRLQRVLTHPRSISSISDYLIFPGLMGPS